MTIWPWIKRSAGIVLRTVKEAYKNRTQTLIQIFKEHSKVKALLKKRALIVIPVTSLLCELESKQANKVIIKAGNYNLEEILNVLHFLANRLIEHRIATNILGYCLREDIGKLEIDDLYAEDEKVYLWLGHPTAK